MEFAVADSVRWPVGVASSAGGEAVEAFEGSVKLSGVGDRPGGVGLVDEREALGGGVAKRGVVDGGVAG